MWNESAIEAKRKRKIMERSFRHFVLLFAKMIFFRIIELKIKATRRNKNWQTMNGQKYRKQTNIYERKNK